MRRMKQILTLLLTAFYLFYFAGTHFFVHSHFINERIVVHSHPFAKSNHTHTTLEIQLIDELSNDTCTTEDGMPTLSPQYSGQWQYAVAPTAVVVVDNGAVRRLRAPPYPAC